MIRDVFWKEYSNNISSLHLTHCCDRRIYVGKIYHLQFVFQKVGQSCLFHCSRCCHYFSLWGPNHSTVYVSSFKGAVRNLRRVLSTPPMNMSPYPLVQATVNQKQCRFLQSIYYACTLLHASAPIRDPSRSDQIQHSGYNMRSQPPALDLAPTIQRTLNFIVVPLQFRWVNVYRILKLHIISHVFGQVVRMLK